MTNLRIVQANLDDPPYQHAVLEVQEKNRPARVLYDRLGFTDGRYQPDAGGVLFRVKPL